LTSLVEKRCKAAVNIEMTRGYTTCFCTCLASSGKNEKSLAGLARFKICSRKVCCAEKPAIPSQLTHKPSLIPCNRILSMDREDKTWGAGAIPLDHPLKLLSLTGQINAPGRCQPISKLFRKILLHGSRYLNGTAWRGDEPQSE
jgi:hypothetical protein